MSLLDPAQITVLAPSGVPEVRPGADLAALLLAALPTPLQAGDIVVVTSKVVSKAAPLEAGLRQSLPPGQDRAAAVAAQTARVVARRGPTSIVRTRHGLTLAAAGIDASNVAAGQILLLPHDPDASARQLRTDLHLRTGVNVGVIVTDTAGRPWRIGQTDIAIGAAGVRVSETFAGRADGYGNPLNVTEPAVADEIASAAELAEGKLGQRPFAVLRGRADLVLPPAEPGPGAAALIRAEGEDLFGLGARQAVIEAVRSLVTGAPEPAFGAPASSSDTALALARIGVGSTPESVPGGLAGLRVEPGSVPIPLVDVVLAAHGWGRSQSNGGPGGGPGGDTGRPDSMLARAHTVPASGGPG